MQNDDSGEEISVSASLTHDDHHVSVLDDDGLMSKVARDGNEKEKVRLLLSLG